jgi:orotate phosphoribosyltransferase/AMMECR1 domain-containing protein
MPADRMADDDRESLRELLIERGFMSADAGRPLRDRGGAPTPWTYYGSEITLSFPGVTLMASSVLERLTTFSSTQLATYGLSAVPILTACLTQGAGRYTGLVVRKQPKSDGARQKIDGPIDRARSAVVIDESLSSGTSAYEAICALEAEGIAVEGIICVIEFSGYGTADWLTARGYRVETVFDVWRDLGRKATQALPVPEAGAPWSDEVLPSGLSAAEVARAVLETLPRTGYLPRPPEQLDRDHDACGGTFVSIRRRTDDARVARGGFRRGGGHRVDPSREVVLAACEALRSAPPGALDDLATLKISVMFLGRPEPIRPGQINHERDGLIVRGLGPLDRLGAALPNAPHYDDELEQYRYAHTTSGRFWHHEPHALYRQQVERVVEPGASWPQYGVPRSGPDWTRDPRWARAITARVWQVVNQTLGEPAAGDTNPLDEPEEQLYAVAVSLYADGFLGCAICWDGGLDAALREAAMGALAQARSTIGASPTLSEKLTISVSLLLRRRRLGRLSPDRLRLFYRLGRDTLHAAAAGTGGLVLAHFAAQQSCDALAYQQQVLRQAGLDGNVAEWTAYETADWIATARCGRRLELGYPVHEDDPCASADARERWLELAAEIAGYVIGQRQPDGLPAYSFSPWSGLQTSAGTATRVLLALTGVLEVGLWLSAELREQTEAMIDEFVAGDRVRVPRDGLRWDSGSDAQLLTCLSLVRREKHRGLALRLVARLRQLIRHDGTIRAGPVRMAADLDFLSGSVLSALARAAKWLGHDDSLAGIELATILAFYERRFALAHPWTMVWWHGEAWSALADRDVNAGPFVFTLVDWALERQSEVSGAFLIHNLEPTRASFGTACVLEGVADAWAQANLIGDRQRAERYGRAWEHGMRFVERLTIRDGDAFFSSNAKAALGGVRATLPSSELRIDYAGHALRALAKGLRGNNAAAPWRQTISTATVSSGPG